MTPKSSAPRAITDLDRGEILGFLSGIGERSYRATQILEWIYRRGILDPSAMTNVPRELAIRLAAEFPAARTVVEAWHESADGTQKALIRLGDGERIESVLIPVRAVGRQGQDSRFRAMDRRGWQGASLTPTGLVCKGEQRGQSRRGAPRSDRIGLGGPLERWTLCVSTQVGCAVRCRFCASGLGGLVRNLSAGEIAEQFLHARNRLAESGGALTNLVVMGMGEPFHNVDSLIKALSALSSEWGAGFGARRITVSTSGVLSGIERLGAAPHAWGLALSLHAPNDELRRELIPHRGLGTLDEILAAGRAYQEGKGRRVTVEYVLLAGTNDLPEHARELANRLAGKGFHVNLIPYNPVAGLEYRAPSRQAVGEFVAALERARVAVTVRQRRGDEISAACGQLRMLHGAT